ncbi:hypothetical protein ZIOFF_073004 [Zingiber officinale]|uniref:Uncharacterized protein n=1 Tax=Zingiber officinale TaxID=94328 RepID=A0A8J5EM41_ZINOF|nr:hypothetical protein ZIOFF_073004 [Zingiber officinale]
MIISFAINNNNTTVVLLNGSNFKKWKQDIEFTLGIVDLDLTIRELELVAITDTSYVSEKELYAKWDRSNRLSLLAIKRSIPEHLLTRLPETNNAKVLFEAIGQRYQRSNHSKGWMFYCPMPGAKIVESQTTKFLEHDTADLETPQQLDIDKQNEVLGINAPIVANAPNPIDLVPENLSGAQISLLSQSDVLDALDVSVSSLRLEDAESPLHSSSSSEDAKGVFNPSHIHIMGTMKDLLD